MVPSAKAPSNGCSLQSHRTRPEKGASSRPSTITLFKTMWRSSWLLKLRAYSVINQGNRNTAVLRPMNRKGFSTSSLSLATRRRRPYRESPSGETIGYQHDLLTLVGYWWAYHAACYRTQLMRGKSLLRPSKGRTSGSNTEGTSVCMARTTESFHMSQRGYIARKCSSS